ncbi:MAG: hypothetical protein H7Y07_05365 [Pyrinomonadaceae bacterium]|nr:hypothetical protein [Sphingobacteriaceae bacterium]
MKKTTNSVSPFIMLLIPALLIIGYKAANAKEVTEEKYQASVCLQMPALKGLIKAFLF